MLTFNFERQNCLGKEEIRLESYKVDFLVKCSLEGGLKTIRPESKLIWTPYTQSQGCLDDISLLCVYGLGFNGLRKSGY